MAQRVPAEQAALPHAAGADGLRERLAEGGLHPLAEHLREDRADREGEGECGEHERRRRRGREHREPAEAEAEDREQQEPGPIGGCRDGDELERRGHRPRDRAAGEQDAHEREDHRDHDRRAGELQRRRELLPDHLGDRLVQLVGAPQVTREQPAEESDVLLQRAAVEAQVGADLVLDLLADLRVDAEHRVDGVAGDEPHRDEGEGRRRPHDDDEAPDPARDGADPLGNPSHPSPLPSRRRTGPPSRADRPVEAIVASSQSARRVNQPAGAIDAVAKSGRPSMSKVSPVTRSPLTVMTAGT